MTTRNLLPARALPQATFVVEGNRKRVGAAGPLPPHLVNRLRETRDRLRTELEAGRIEQKWKPGHRIAYRDAAGSLEVVRFMGVSVGGAVNFWTNDGLGRPVPVESVALDWVPDAAEIFEERLAIMLEADVPEEVARERAEALTREYLKRIKA